MTDYLFDSNALYYFFRMQKCSYLKQNKFITELTTERKNGAAFLVPSQTIYELLDSNFPDSTKAFAIRKLCNRSHFQILSSNWYPLSEEDLNCLKTDLASGESKIICSDVSKRHLEYQVNLISYLILFYTLCLFWTITDSYYAKHEKEIDYAAFFFFNDVFGLHFGGHQQALESALSNVFQTSSPGKASSDLIRRLLEATCKNCLTHLLFIDNQLNADIARLLKQIELKGLYVVASTSFATLTSDKIQEMKSKYRLSFSNSCFPDSFFEYGYFLLTKIAAFSRKIQINDALDASLFSFLTGEGQNAYVLSFDRSILSFEKEYWPDYFDHISKWIK